MFDVQERQLRYPSRHNSLRDLIAEILDEVCIDVEVEPPLLPLIIIIIISNYARQYSIKNINNLFKNFKIYVEQKASVN